ncbi:2-dehydro-3-deoxygalactonokinase [Tatumella citrea]|uniref:2-oxo-3-deoxygalactonate kinase n=1 Tax=Tatumella citrea TaxID=53336 RepID=A0A1Y0LGJ3_TATCI|nr:2-dehydro-3-deoxygalactonokinase [Tatumella citrea]ARU92732.1 2-oxo-3-deoxygalactonate kinase [Tatumella citrea]ARU96770.1 2-oxo-3-deoxygalactonate kinase [Tatumella citrea]
MTSGYIAIDWGSTNLRAWWYQAGECRDRRTSSEGITRLGGKSPAAVLAGITAGWPENIRVLMAGMVGSTAGWKVAPYLPCPVRFSEIGSQLTDVLPGISIIPGLSIRRSDNDNVMRGEETQLLGARQLAAAPLFILPGTHCKWVQADNEQIYDFRTVMTGELHHLLINSSLIGAGLPEQRQSPTVFEQGTEIGLATEAPLVRLFEVRAAHVLGDLPREDVSEYLSGLLIGHEVASMIRQWQPDHRQPVTIVASHSLASRYQKVLNILGFKAQILEGDSAFQAGIRSIADAVAD